MKCLECHEELVSAKLGDLSIEQCSACGGVWLERGELDRLVEEQEEDLRWMESELWKEAKKLSGHPSSRQCPHGHGSLVTLEYEDSGVEVDVCPVCGGTWLDAGELKKIVDYLAEEADSMSLSGYTRESLREARELLAGDEDRLSEWKDLRAVLRLMRTRLAVEHPTIAAIIKSLPR